MSTGREHAPPHESTSILEHYPWHGTTTSPSDSVNHPWLQNSRRASAGLSPDVVPYHGRGDPWPGDQQFDSGETRPCSIGRPILTDAGNPIVYNQQRWLCALGTCTYCLESCM